jgi:hypothetical protein
VTLPQLASVRAHTDAHAAPSSRGGRPPTAAGVVPGATEDNRRCRSAALLREHGPSAHGWEARGSSHTRVTAGSPTRPPLDAAHRSSLTIAGAPLSTVEWQTTVFHVKRRALPLVPRQAPPPYPCPRTMTALLGAKRHSTTFGYRCLPQSRPWSRTKLVQPGYDGHLWTRCALPAALFHVKHQRDAARRAS